MDRKTYSNRVQSNGNSDLVPGRRFRPAFAKPYAGLTDKERVARTIQKTATYTGGYGGMGMGGNVAFSNQWNFYSPQLSTDFLELPQSLREKRELYRHFYNADPIVGQAIDLHTELPLSKVRLAAPKPSTFPKGFEDQHDYAQYILWYFKEMCSDIKLFQKLVTMVHHYWLDGGCCVFAEDSEVEIPPEIGHDVDERIESTVGDDGEIQEIRTAALKERADKDEREFEYYQSNYKGWDRLIILPLDQVKLTQYPYTDKMRYELIPSEKDRELVMQANMGDEFAAKAVQEIPEDVLQHLETGQNIPLGDDPDEGSFCYYLAAHKAAGEDLGQSILDRCHIPGTLVWAKTPEGIVNKLIETLNPDTDFVLGGSGEWRDFEIGSRPYSGPLTGIKVSKLEHTTYSTPDHRYEVLRDGELITVEAQEVRVGDYIRVAQVKSAENPIDKMDLSEGIYPTRSRYIRGRNKETDLVDITVSQEGSESILLRYEYNRSLKEISFRVNVNSVLDWLSTLTEPVDFGYSEIKQRFGFPVQLWQSIRTRLLDIGYPIEDIEHGIFRAQPNVQNIREQYTKIIHKLYPRTIPLTPEIGYLLGYWLGDGCICKPTNGIDYGYFAICWGNDVECSLRSVYDHIVPTLKGIGGELHFYNHGNIRNSSHLTQRGCDAFAHWVGHHFGDNSGEKRIPAWVFERTTEEFRLALFRGLIDSDGYVYLRDQSKSVTLGITNTNIHLARGIHLLYTSLDLPASITTPTPPDPTRKIRGELIHATKPKYVIRFSSKLDVIRVVNSGYLSKKPGFEYLENKPERPTHFVRHQESLYYKVWALDTKERYNGDVWSLNVHKDHTFFVNGHLTRNCLRALTYKEKLRQAQTQIASRAMTPKRIVTLEGGSELDIMDLREQVDMALVDPDFSIVSNSAIEWNDVGARDRLLDLSSEYETIDRQLYAGLGVTESLLSGESLYSGDRIKLEVINTRYLFLREMLQEYVEQYLFKPVARRKGFVEKNRWGGEVVLYPKLQFTRLPLRDSQDTYDALFNLYNKGSLDVSTLLELFNIDPDDTRAKLEQDLFTVNDPLFNEGLRSIYGQIADAIVNNTDVADRIGKAMKLNKVEPKPESEDGGFDRF